MDFDLIISEHYKAIFAYALHLSRSRADAEDITQDTFLKAQRNISHLKTPQAVKSWLYSIARNRYFDKRRSLKYLMRYIREKSEVESHSVGSELELILSQLINSLPERQREVFILRHWHRFSTAETAELLKIDQGSVKSHLARAIAKLKQGLAPQLDNRNTSPSVKSTKG